MASDPMICHRRYPSLGKAVMRPPDRMAPTGRPTAMGMSDLPESVALCRKTYWKVMGRKTYDPVMTMPAATLMTAPTAKLRMRNRRSGMMGSAAKRASTTAKTTSSAAAPQRSPMMVGEDQSYFDPPHVTPRQKQTTAPTMAAMPA